MWITVQAKCGHPRLVELLGGKTNKAITVRFYKGISCQDCRHERGVKANFEYTNTEIDPNGVLDDASAFIHTIIRRTRTLYADCGWHVFPQIPYDELYHEGCKALWELLNVSGVPAEECDIIPQCARAVATAIRHYINDLKGRPSGEKAEVQLSAIPDVFAFADPVHAEASEESKQISAALIKLAERVLRVGRGKEDGDRDVIILKLFAQGMNPEAVASWCSWLKNADSAKKALVRIVLLIRESIPGADRSAPIHLGEDSRTHASRGVLQDKQAYDKRYYQNRRTPAQLAIFRERQRLYRTRKKAERQATQ